MALRIYTVIFVSILCLLSLPYALETQENSTKIVTPDNPEYIEKLTDELINVSMAATNKDKILVFSNMLDERVRELEAVIKQKKNIYIPDIIKAFNEKGS